MRHWKVRPIRLTYAEFAGALGQQVAWAVFDQWGTYRGFCWNLSAAMDAARRCAEVEAMEAALQAVAS